MKPNKIIYIGIVNDEETKLVGGFVVANERNINEYQKRGYEVEVLKFPTMPQKTVQNIAVYLQKLFRFTRKAKKTAKINKNQNILVHITPHYDLHLIGFAYLAVRHFFKNDFKILIDIRAGAFIRKFKKYGPAYRAFMTRFLKMGSYLSVEGEKYLPFVKNITEGKIPVHFYPNYVRDEQILQHPRSAFDDKLQLMYFGRVNDDKGIPLLLELHRLLTRNYNVKTVIIGSGEKNYITQLKKRIDKAQLNIAVHPPQPKEFINRELLQSHFFVFPTVHKGEGHSNSLSEAMAYGAVPLVSDNGFNKSVVKGAGKVFKKTAKAEAYARAIEKILSDGKWEEYSEKARLKILNHYSNKTVSDRFFNFITSP